MRFVLKIFLLAMRLRFSRARLLPSFVRRQFSWFLSSPGSAGAPPHQKSVTRLVFAALLAAGAAAAENIGPLELRQQTTAGTQGILLADLVTNRTDQPLPRIVLAPAPQIGRPLFFTRAQVTDLLTKKAPELTCTNWSGADRIKVTRATRILTQPLLNELLTGTLQSEQIKDRG